MRRDPPPDQKPEAPRPRVRRTPIIVDSPPAFVPPRRRPVKARPLEPMQRPRRTLPPGVEAPESGDDWRDAWRWIQTEWRKFRADPRGYIRDALQVPDDWRE